MIPLGGDTFPTTSAELADALRIALRRFVRVPDERAAVTADADRLRIDLSGGVAAIPERVEDSSGVGPKQPGPTFQSLVALGIRSSSKGPKFTSISRPRMSGLILNGPAPVGQ